MASSAHSSPQKSTAPFDEVQHLRDKVRQLEFELLERQMEKEDLALRYGKNVVRMREELDNYKHGARRMEIRNRNLMEIVNGQLERATNENEISNAVEKIYGGDQEFVIVPEEKAPKPALKDEDSQKEEKKMEEMKLYEIERRKWQRAQEEEKKIREIYISREFGVPAGWRPHFNEEQREFGYFALLIVIVVSVYRYVGIF